MDVANVEGTGRKRLLTCAAQFDDTTRWYDASDMTIEGQGWTDVEARYDRLPQRAQAQVSSMAWLMSRCSAGLCVRFVTNSKRLVVHWKVTRLDQPSHMSPTGMRGVDLYARAHEGWRWVATGLAGRHHENQRELVRLEESGEFEYLLYFPLYNALEYLFIGIDADAELWEGPPYPSQREKPLCFYGTSLTQGACASRPGMSYPAIVGRWLQRPVINLGFSGSGRMEGIMAPLVGELDSAAYLLDCIPNMSLEQVEERVRPFVMTLRALHPETPIVLIAPAPYQDVWFNPESRRKWAARDEALGRIYHELTAAGIQGLSHISSERLAGTDGEASVANHSTDLGFMRYAERVFEHLNCLGI